MSATQFNITHQTCYEFEKPVFLEPHILRFFPITTEHFRLRSFSLEIAPSPIGQNSIQDISGAIATLCWFENLHTSLTIEASLAVSVAPHNPFSFLIHPPQNMTLPVQYAAEDKAVLSAALSVDAHALSNEILDFVQMARSRSKNETIPFLSELNYAISKEFELKSRHEGAPNLPKTTFSEKSGSCRDLAWMQICMLRHVGIATRFVSGYFYLEAEDPTWELHAWTEVFIPGAGWKGFDPSHGIVCADRHIAVTTSPVPALTLPVTGAYRGDAKATLTHQIDMKKETV